ncbi:unnamed protein product, partial [Hymenolepis diminuta]
MTSQSPPTDLLSSLKRTENLLRKSISNSCILENYINWARNMPSIDAPNMADQLTLLVDAFSDVVLLRIPHLLYREVNILPNPQPTDEKFHQKVNSLGVCDLIHRLELTNSEY